MRSRNQSPKLRALFTANTVRGMRYPLRRTIKTAPRNIVTNEIQQGHYTCTPSITIGDGESWLLLSMCLGCHVHVALSAWRHGAYRKQSKIHAPVGGRQENKGDLGRICVRNRRTGASTTVAGSFRPSFHMFIAYKKDARVGNL